MRMLKTTMEMLIIWRLSFKCWGLLLLIHMLVYYWRSQSLCGLWYIIYIKQKWSTADWINVYQTSSLICDRKAHRVRTTGPSISLIGFLCQSPSRSGGAHVDQGVGDGDHGGVGGDLGGHIEHGRKGSSHASSLIGSVNKCFLLWCSRGRPQDGLRPLFGVQIGISLFLGRC